MMERRVTDLSAAHFVEYPVWKWDEAQEFHCPVSSFEPLPEDEGTLFIRSRFEAPDGLSFDGYLVGTRTFFAFGIFIEDQEYLINLNLPDMAGNTITEMSEVLGLNDLELFPLGYETTVHFQGEPNLKGVLNL